MAEEKNMSHESSFYIGKPIKPYSETPSIECDSRGFGRGLSDEARRDIELIEGNIRQAAHNLRNFFLD